jgi:glycosyltransferase involved in cell wall biosynthesis
VELPDKNALALRVLSNCYAMRDAGYNPIIVGYCRSKVPNKIMDTKTTVQGFDCYNVPYPKCLFQWMKDSLTYKKIEKVILSYGIDNVKAIIFTEIGAPNVLGLMRFTKKNNIRMISDTVDWFDSYSNNPIKKILQIINEKISVNLLKPKIKNIICISSFLSNHYKGKNCNTVIIPSLTINDTRKYSFNRVYKPNPIRSYIYVGNPGYKGIKDRIDWCIQAFSELFNTEDAILKVYGIERKEYIEQFGCQSILKDNIFFYGKQPNSHCIQEIQRADFFVFAREDRRTTKAGFPTKFSESLSCGTPVITTPSGDLKNYLYNNINGYISNECTYDSFKEALVKSKNCSDDKLIAMNEHCLQEHPLFYKKWINLVDNYLHSIIYS